MNVTPVKAIEKKLGDPVTNEDVEKHIKIPEGGKIISIGDKPSTDIPGDRPSIPVEIELPGGKRVVVNIPVKVTTTPNPTPSTPTTKVITHFVDENGKDITSPEEGLKDPKALEGYEFVNSTKDSNGHLVHHYKKVATPQPAGPTAPEQPATPAEPGRPATPNQTQPAAPAQADATVATDTTAKPATPKYVDGQKELPNTGTEANASLVALGLLGALGGFGLLARKKKED